MDEHEDVHEQRKSSRREYDITRAAEFALLRREVQLLRDNMVKDEVDFEARIHALEEKLFRFETQLANGKGILYGSAAVIGVFFAGIATYASAWVKEILHIKP